jgi:lipopolysaccharide transport system ATP-binding protein
MTDNIISVMNVSKCYQVFDNDQSRLLHAIWKKHTAGMKELWAIKEINFEIKRGEAVAIIGRNGGGKSTLLQILTGILTPTTGQVLVNGRVSALLELGSGFNPEYSGRENVMLNGLLLGLTRERILNRFNEIEDFAEIGDAIDRPVKTYSSGMIMRLAFAVQVLCDPDILIIDEALSVGDFFFQQKCLGYIRELSEKGVTLLFVSHDMGAVRDVCRRAIFLQAGKVMLDGETTSVIQKYLESWDPSQTHTLYSKKNTPIEKYEMVTTSEFGTIFSESIWKSSSDIKEIEPGQIVCVAFYDEQGKVNTAFRLGDNLCVKVFYMPPNNESAHITLVIKNKLDQVITTLGSSRLKLVPPMQTSKCLMMFELKISLMLEAGNYSVQARLGLQTAPNQGKLLYSTDWLGPINIFWNYDADVAPFTGMVGLPTSGEFKLYQNEVLV